LENCLKNMLTVSNYCAIISTYNLRTHKQTEENYEKEF